jgi:ferric-dicitrate binding protein FerR (iron transport regulator)
VSTLEPRVPAALERVVSTCLAKDPDERWQSAGDLARELKGIASGSHAAAQPAILHSARSSRVAMGLVGIAAAVLGAAIVFAAFSLRPETPVDAPASPLNQSPAWMG